jgi:outer membrane protein assembly factor BamE (lipoprotein component of BamABCDE complex)
MVLKRILGTLLCALVLCGCAVQEKRSDRIRSQHPEWDANTVSKLAARNIENGMTRSMVQAALGPASSVSKEGEEEVWTYTAWHEDAYVGPNWAEVVYTVRFKGDKVVGKSGDINNLQGVF